LHSARNGSGSIAFSIVVVVTVVELLVSR